MVFARVKVIKSKEKENITASVSKDPDGSFKSWNFTGSLVELDGFVTKDGINFDQELVEIDCPTTILISKKEQGESVYERCAEIFEQRARNNDPNPAIDLVIEAKTVRPKETNILIVNITSIFVDSDTQIVDSSEIVENAIAKLKANSASKPKPQVSAARNSLTNMLGRGVTRIVKTYL
jgi:hypothetical protein